MSVAVNEPDTADSPKRQLVAQRRVTGSLAAFQVDNMMGLEHLVVIVKMKLKVVL